MSALSVFQKFSRYPATRPYRWRAFGVQLARDVFDIALIPLCLPLFLLSLALFPFWWLRERLDDWRPFAPMAERVRDWHARHSRELYPLLKGARDDERDSHDANT